MKKKFLTIFIALVLVLSFSLVTAVPVAAADPTTIASSTMVFEGTLTDNGDGTYSGTIPMLETEPEGLGDGIAGFDVYARDGATAVFINGGVTYQTIASHDAWPTWDPDTPDWDCYALMLDSDSWKLVYNENDPRNWVETSGVPMSGTMNWSAMYASETNSGSGWGAFGDDGRIWWSDSGWAAENGGGAACWDMDWGSPNWSEVVPLAFPGFNVAITDLGGDSYRVTMTPAAGANPAGPVVNENTGESYGTIQDAIDAAIAGETISVAAGTYVEDLTIPGTKTNLELVGATGAKIKGVLEQDWPTHTPAISILASGVKIHGFTIESPDYSRTDGNPHSSGITVGSANVEIYDNTFVATDDGTGNSLGWCTLIETYGQYGGDVSGLNIYDNTFTSDTGTDKGSEGIFINYNLNNPTPAGTVTIENNTFGGQLFRAISTERSKTTISGNTISSSYAPNPAFNAALRGIDVFSSGRNPNIDTVVITGSSVNGFWQGIRLGDEKSDPPDVLTNISLIDNTVEMNDTGIRVYVSAGGVVEGNVLYGNWAGIEVEPCGDTPEPPIISGNTLENNVVHVGDYWETEMLDIQVILDNNTFDRTVLTGQEGSWYPWIFGSIAEAVSWAYDGDTVLASAGIYDEQVVISRLLTLQGAGDATVIKPSSESKLKYFMGLNAQPGALFNNDSVAGIVNAKFTLAPGPIIIKDLKVDGGNIDAAHPIADYIAGIFGLGMNGIIDNVTVVNMGTSTEQPRTYGIWLDSVLWDASVEVKNCTITGYNRNGINARGAMQAVDIHDNTITGPGPSDIQVPNGIMLLNGVTGEVNNNIISNMAYTPEQWWSAGIMFYESSGSAIGNTITDCQIGILYQDGGGTAQGNIVNGGTVGLVGLWAQYLVPGAWDVSFVENTVSVANDDTYYPLENAAIGVQTVDAGAFINATINGNQVTANEGTSADGIIIGDFSQPGNITATITNNTVSGWQHGIRLVSSVAAGTTITGNNITNNISPNSGIHIEAGVDATNVRVNFNSIVGNQGYGVYNGGDGILNTTNNWWGDATGPYNLTTNPGGLGNAVSDNVTFSPWLYPPTVVTAAASSLSTTSATLNGSLDDLGSALSVAVSFEWGLTTAYGNIVAVTPLSEAGVFSATLSGLSDDTTYHFRAKAVGDGPDVYGDDITFATKAKPAPAPPTYYTDTNLFGTEESFRISKDGELLEAIEATSEDGMLTITIPKDTVALDEDGKRLASLETAVDESPPDPPADAHVIGLAYDFGPEGATFDPPLTLEYTYDPDALPEGVAEEDLVIAYYDEEAGEWIELDCVVDTVNNTITASVAHFTTFAIIGVVPPVVVAPAPAAFTISSLGVSLSELAPGEEVNISVLVANTGGESGSYSVVLKINGVKEQEKLVTITAGRSKTVTFSVTKEEAGSYTITVDGLSGSFTVVPVVVPPAPAAFSVSRLSFQPAEVEAGTAVTIAVLVSNIGGTEGSYTVVLKVNGIKEAEKTVTIAAGDSQEVSFSLTRDPGTYSVSVDGLSGGFTVIVVTPPPGVNWSLVGGIIAAAVIVAGLLIYFLVVRRRAA